MIWDSPPALLQVHLKSPLSSAVGAERLPAPALCCSLLLRPNQDTLREPQFPPRSDRRLELPWAAMKGCGGRVANPARRMRDPGKSAPPAPVWVSGRKWSQRSGGPRLSLQGLEHRALPLAPLTLTQHSEGDYCSLPSAGSDRALPS